ncbi:floral homeotic protein AGAMOUS-like isoform X2 [Wolffia australiana]
MFVTSGELRPLPEMLGDCWRNSALGFRDGWRGQGASACVKATIDRYKKACSTSGPVVEVNAEFYQKEADSLRRQIANLQGKIRNCLGEDVNLVESKKLKNLEKSLEEGIKKIRARKNELLRAEIEYMQRREVELQNDNKCLRARVSKIIETERGSQLLPGTYDGFPPMDSRTLLSGSVMEQAHHYPPQHETSLHLGMVLE